MPKVVYPPNTELFRWWYSGERDLVTSSGTAGADLEQYTLVMRSDGKIVAWDEKNVAEVVGFLALKAITNGPAVVYLATESGRLSEKLLDRKAA